MPSKFLAAIKENPFIGIMRDVQLRHLRPLFGACSEAHLGFLEITMNTEGAADLIRALVAIRDASGFHMRIGAGTVRSREMVLAAANAGAEFIVSPGFQLDVQMEALKLGLPSLPGALTPAEIETAWRAGATMVKVFPAKTMGGPAYFRELRGPFRDIPLLACGGVAPDNAAEYLAAGADALAFGASILRPTWIEAGEYDKVSASIQALRLAIKDR